MSIQSTSQSWKSSKYDVFLSFRGEDIRNTFIDHFYAHLTRKGVCAFKDDQKLEKGEPISPQLIQAIRNSRVCVVVFSKDYARSTWCLDEMATIYECIATGQTVLPVFYDVDPSHVRNQNGVYRHAFHIHIKKFRNETAKVDGWKRAMTGLANLAGFDVRNRPEFGEIEKIVQVIVKKLGREENTEQGGSSERTKDLQITNVVFPSKSEHSSERIMDDLELREVDFDTTTMATNNFSEANKPSGQRLPGLKNIVLEAIKKLSYKRWTEHRGKRELKIERNMDGIELSLFDFNAIKIATNNFSTENKLGQGGFGSVYKGMLMDGQEIAVKRLSTNSKQGLQEFLSEVRLLVKLQHQNLIRLFGCSIQTGEKMLVYEYMQNGGLDSWLFDMEKRSSLDWQRRYNIICGTARSLLYLHQESRIRIIHRDIKASNILLDREMNPKLSDFGMARIIGSNQTEAYTARIVGTYGYLAPEYAMNGIFSVKSDVFSFGVLVLEIISGKKNRLGHAWKIWQEGNALELIDSSLGNSYSPSEVLRCIQVGLLCIQEHAEDRPTMSSVVLMLSSESPASMPQPKTPGFYQGKNPVETDSSSSSTKALSCSCSFVTVTVALRPTRTEAGQSAIMT